MALVTGTKSAYTADTNRMLNTQRATGMPEVADNAATLPITSTNIEIYSNGMKIGFVQSFTPSEQRQITKVQELGTEGVVQSVPGNTNGGQIQLTRFAIFNGSLFNALGLTPSGLFTEVADQIYNNASVYQSSTNTLGNPFKTLKEQRCPLELQAKTKQPDEANETWYCEVFVDCWISQYGKTIATNQITITETATLQYCDVYSVVASGDGGW